MTIDKDSQEVPNLRFKGFTDDWEQRKLRDIANRISKTSSSIELPKVEFEDIIAGEGRLNKDLSKKLDNRKGIEFQPFDVLYGKLRPYLKNWLFSDFIGIALGDFWVLRANGLTPSFLYTLIQSDNFQRVANDTSGTKMPRSDWKKVSSTKFYIPLNIKEQKKIGDLISQLDQTITLHQRKLDQLNRLKEALLQQMFPGKGEMVPKLRFAGFEGDWEQRKLGDVLTVSKEKNKSNYYSKEQVLSVSREVGTVNQIEYQGRSFAGANISGYKIVYPGQLIYTKSPLKGAPYGIFQLVTEEGIVSPLYAVYNSTEQALASFIGLELKSDNIATHYLSPLVSKGAKNTINITDEGALDGRVTYPTITEQQKIVVFFKQLENTITLQQRKLDQLKNMKQILLQNMFI